MKKIIPFILFGAGIILVSFAVFTLYFSRSEESPLDAELPASVAGHSLSSNVSGTAAIVEINRMHGKEFPLLSGAVGEYGSRTQVKIWVSGAEEDGSSFLVQMEEKIAEGRSPFTILGERTDGERVVYELEGLGQMHFYFQSLKYLIWLAVDEGISQQALKETLEFYP